MRPPWCGLVLAGAIAFAQPAPEECLVGPRDKVVERASFRGREYTFKRVGCKALFESDPERYAQLFDALMELRDAGQQLSPSLVPS